MRAGLANVFQVDPAFFEDGAEVNPAAREVMEGFRFLGSIHQGQTLGLAARGNNAGLSPEMIAEVNELVAELQDRLSDTERRGRWPQRGDQSGERDSDDRTVPVPAPPSMTG